MLFLKRDIAGFCLYSKLNMYLQLHLGKHVINFPKKNRLAELAELRVSLMSMYRMLKLHYDN